MIPKVTSTQNMVNSWQREIVQSTTSLFDEVD